MAIKVSFNAGDRTAVIGGLYQWDYGQVLEIESLELGTELMEVHFACPGMSEAIVRSCQFVDGIGTVTIPDQCLEQTGNITAWVYSISATQGHTIKTITLPITGRMRPSALRDVPPEYINKYAEAIEEINEAVNAIEQGNVTVAKAITADTATSATTSKNAESATYATSAGSATTAGSAGTINKYLHNLRMNLSHTESSGNKYEGSLFIQIITSSSVQITMNNIAEQISVSKFNYETPIPCSGYISKTTDSEHKIYYAAGLGFNGISYIFPVGFDALGNEGPDVGFAFSSYTVAYDAVVKL